MTEPSSLPTPDSGPPGGRRDWRAVAAHTLLGATVGGAAINILSASHGWRFVTLVAATGTALIVPVWLGRYPARSHLVTWATRILLSSAIAAATLAAFGPASLATLGMIAAGLLATAAVLIPTAPHDRLNMMTEIAFIAAGVAIVGLGAASLLGNEHLVGMAFIALGVAIAGLGAASLLDNVHLLGMAFIALDVAIAGSGAASLVGNEHLLGMAFIALGVAIAGLGAAWLLDNVHLGGMAFIAFGVILVRLGAESLLYNVHLLFGIATGTFGMTVVGFGAALLLDNGVGRWVRRLWARLTTDPARQPAETGEGAGTAADSANDR